MRSTGNNNSPALGIMNTNEYMLQLHKRLCEKTYGTPPRNVGESTASAYIKTLYNLNEKKPFKNLAFLKKTDDILKKLSAYAESTQKTLVSTIASVLSLDKDKPGYKTVYKFYYDKMMEKAKVANDTSEKTTKQEENWIDWDDVVKKYGEMSQSVASNKKPSVEHLLPILVLGLYVEIPPRRNQDYLQMKVIRATPKQKTDTLDKEHNYLVVRGKVPEKFIFNKYKTHKTYGTQTVDVPPALSEILKKYLKVHPQSGEKLFPFLVTGDGAPITADNAITRILNRVFGKNVGSSMLRHIYLSSKYDITQMKEDSEAMGHSLNQQREYLKADTPPLSPSSQPEPAQS